MFEAITAYGISGRAAKRDIVQVTCINPRDFAEGNYRRVDERPFGGTWYGDDGGAFGKSN